MVGLLNIAAACETVDVCGQPVVVRGVSAAGVAHLLGQFPELRKLVSGIEMDASDMIARAPDAVAAIIAAGIGFPGDADQEAAAAGLPLEAQADLIAAILRQTMPKGIGPFLEKLTALGSGLGAEVSTKAPDTSSPKP